MTSKYSDEFKATVKAMWNDGKLAREIADATGTTTSVIASFIQYHRSEFPRHDPGKPRSADWHKPEIVDTIRTLVDAGANYKTIKAVLLDRYNVKLSTGRLSGALTVLKLRLRLRSNLPTVDDPDDPAPTRTSTLPPLRSELLRQQQGTQYDQSTDDHVHFDAGR